MRFLALAATLVVGCARPSAAPPPPAPAPRPVAVAPKAEEPACRSNIECDDQICESGRCSPCTQDNQCPVGHCEEGRCEHGPPGPAGFSGLAPAYRDWLEVRVEIARRGNQQPDAYAPCTVGRRCALNWDMTWQLFEPNSAEVDANPKIPLMLSEGFEDDPSARVTLVGHAAPTEDDPEALAKARAAAVFDWLVNEGLDGSRIDVKAVGATRPVYPLSSDRGRRTARRVEFLLESDASPVGWWPLPRHR